jgi:hypothetical protein
VKGTTGPEVPPQVAGLWPPPARAVVARRTGAGQVGYLVVPSLRRPRVLMPLRVADADRMLSRHGGNPAERAVRLLWRAGVRSTLAERLPAQRLAVTPAPDGIETHLADVLGHPVRMGVLLGPPRANLKPVLQIFDEIGATVAFAKLGMTALTTALLETEASALALLAARPRSTFTAPTLLHHGNWHDTPVLVQQALSLSQSEQAAPGAPVDVMAEIAAVNGISTRRLSGSRFLDGVHVDDGRPDAIAQAVPQRWHDVDLSPFARLNDRLLSVDDCPFGSWHGDFGPWNMATDGTFVEVWDWERFEVDVPVGMDAAHYRAQVDIAARGDAERSWGAMVADVAAVQTALGVDAGAAETVAACYLVAICARYRRDAATGPTPALLRRIRWLAAAADVAVRSLEGTPA